MLMLKPTTYILAMAFHPASFGDVLYVVTCDDVTADTIDPACSYTWRVPVRMRIYHPCSVDPFDGRDEKRLHYADISGTPAGALAFLHETIGRLTREHVDVLDVGGDPVRLFEVMRTQPWCHVSTVEAQALNVDHKPRAQA